MDIERVNIVFNYDMPEGKFHYRYQASGGRRRPRRPGFPKGRKRGTQRSRKARLRRPEKP